MYSRNISGGEYRIPEHYSGVAFRTPRKNDPSDEKRDAAGRPSALPKENPAIIGDDRKSPQKIKSAPIKWRDPLPMKEDITEDEILPSEPESKPPEKQEDKQKNKLSGFFDSDEALIAALILLLLGSSDDSDSQTLLLLLLILIY